MKLSNGTELSKENTNVVSGVKRNGSSTKGRKDAKAI
jgi:hypothetical protein